MKRKTKAEIEYQLIWKLSILSTLFGVGLAIWMKESQSSVPIMLLGLAHGVVFIPAMSIARANLWKMVGLSIVCVTFPIWGYFFVGIMAGAVGAPIANSIIWGIIVVLALKQPKAILVFLVIGIVSNAAFYYFMFVSKLNTMGNLEGGFAETIGLWYLLVLPAFPFLIRVIHEERSKLATDSCHCCGYPYLGLPSLSPCPECGMARLAAGFPPAAFEGED